MIIKRYIITLEGAEFNYEVQIMNVRKILLIITVGLIDIFGSIGVVFLATKIKSFDRQSAVMSFILLTIITTFALASTVVYFWMKFRYRNNKSDD